MNCFDFYFIVEKYLTFRNISDTQVYSYVTLKRNIFSYELNNLLTLFSLS